jgi:hypothetical protein
MEPVARAVADDAVSLGVGAAGDAAGDKGANLRAPADLGAYAAISKVGGRSLLLD